MPLPFFYIHSLQGNTDTFTLDENNSRHIVQVLRMQPGEKLRVTDGKGMEATATIAEANKKKCIVQLSEKELQPAPACRTMIAVSLLKNASRFEWFLEKATELGISEIIPLKCTRTEKQQFRNDRMQGILESALIQSQQVWMPLLHAPQVFEQWIDKVSAVRKLIAHCESGPRQNLHEMISHRVASQLILIGPEGDFTPVEIKQALSAGFIGVALGENRLRSETAAVAAGVLMKLSAVG